MKVLSSDIERMKIGGAFKKYIDFIQFPYFRNLDNDSRITFDFPLTVFVGQNGSGKSSTLHALYGAPMKNTPFEFWFSTAVDPIVEVSQGGDRHCFFYVYRDKHGKDLEVLKLRILKRNNPDYWETSRPVLKYGMKKLPRGKRNEPIEKDVVYIDFRSELSAFDKYFYFKSPKAKSKSKNKQEYLRKKSVSLKNIIDEKVRFISPSGVNQNEILIKLSSAELESISYILGKEYDSGKIVKHKLFEEWGISIYLKTKFYEYSEAFAGSGEMAVVRLVSAVLNAKEYSLILLDEPEVSLHPGAQKRLREFLLEQIKLKKHQVIISSHSPTIIEGLPSKAIKVFSQLPTGKFIINNESTPEEAFFHLEQTNPNQKTIIVEDNLAKEIICGVLKIIGPSVESLFDVVFNPGGESVLKKHFIPVYSSETNWNKFVIFDGDQKKVNTHFDVDTILANEQTNERFKKEIIDQTGVDVQFYPDGNQSGGNVEQLKELSKTYLKYYLRNVFYLPCSKPEDIIWNQSLAENLLISLGKENEIDHLSSLKLSKEKLKHVSVAIHGNKNNMESTEEIFLNYWLNQPDDNFSVIKDTINQLKKF